MLLGILCVLVSTVPTGEPRSISFAWDPPASSNIAGYYLFRGVASRQYDFSQNVGLSTNAIISGLNDSATYFFALRAYDEIGQVSDFSEEVSFSFAPPVAPISFAPLLSITLDPQRGPVVRARGSPGTSVQISVSHDLENWEPVITIVLDETGTYELVDPFSITNACSYYRLKPLEPDEPDVTHADSSELLTDD